MAARSLIGLILAGILCCHSIEPVRAGPYPDRPVRVVVPFAPGGTTDVVARIVGAKLSQEFGQQFFIENKGGAGGVLGADMVAKAPPDGYTVLLFHIGLIYSKSLYKNVPFDVVKDFAPISTLGIAPSILIVGPKVQARTLSEFIALARSRPGDMNYGSAGIGTSSHLAVELFQSLANVKLTHVPYKGGGPALVAVMGGEIECMIETLGTVAPHVDTAAVRALAVTSKERFGGLSQIPTMEQAGLPGYVYSTWYGLWAPAGTPPDILATLNTALQKILRYDDVKETLFKAGIIADTASQQDFAALIKADIVKWDKIISENGLKPQ
jgi:tripartite-type tricarboxylate transporter receptor subunit TctC